MDSPLTGPCEDEAVTPPPGWIYLITYAGMSHYVGKTRNLESRRYSRFNANTPPNWVSKIETGPISPERLAEIRELSELELLEELESVTNADLAAIEEAWIVLIQAELNGTDALKRGYGGGKKRYELQEYVIEAGIRNSWHVATMDKEQLRQAAMEVKRMEISKLRGEAYARWRGYPIDELKKFGLFFL